MSQAPLKKLFSRPESLKDAMTIIVQAAALRRPSTGRRGT